MARGNRGCTYTAARTHVEADAICPAYQKEKFGIGGKYPGTAIQQNRTRLHKAAIGTNPDTDEPTTPTDTTDTSDIETENRHIFELLDRKINEGKMFLNPDLTRDDLVHIAHTDKNRLAKIMQQHEFANTSDYVNRKRLDYAATELKSHPEYTINAIAESCGLPNVPTFNRLFRKRFGMTPSEFRKTLSTYR